MRSKWKLYSGILISEAGCFWRSEMEEGMTRANGDPSKDLLISGLSMAL